MLLLLLSSEFLMLNNIHECLSHHIIRSFYLMTSKTWKCYFHEGDIWSYFFLFSFLFSSFNWIHSILPSSVHSLFSFYSFDVISKFELHFYVCVLLYKNNNKKVQNKNKRLNLSLLLFITFFLVFLFFILILAFRFFHSLILLWFLLVTTKTIFLKNTLKLLL